MHLRLARNVRHAVAMLHARLTYRLIAQCLVCLDPCREQRLKCRAVHQPLRLGEFFKLTFTLKQGSLDGAEGVIRGFGALTFPDSTVFHPGYNCYLLAHSAHYGYRLKKSSLARCIYPKGGIYGLPPK